MSKTQTSVSRKQTSVSRKQRRVAKKPHASRREGAPALPDHALNDDERISCRERYTRLQLQDRASVGSR